MTAALSLAGDLQEFGAAADAQLPSSIEELCARVAEVPGVALDRLLAGLDPGLVRTREALAALVREARESAAAEGAAAHRLTAVQAAAWGMTWEPVLAALVAAERRNSAAQVKLRQHLAHLTELNPMSAPSPAYWSGSRPVSAVRMCSPGWIPATPGWRGARSTRWPAG